MTPWIQFQTIIKNLKWIIILAALLCVLLFVPDQIRELYRIAAAEDGPFGLAVSSHAVNEFVSVLAIGVTLWFGAVLLAADTLWSLPTTLSPVPRRVFECLPLAIGAAPLVVTGVAQFFAAPDKIKFAAPVGSVIHIEQDLLSKVNLRLDIYGCLFIVLAAGFVWAARKLHPRIIPVAKSINDQYFSIYRFIGVSALVIVAITGILLWFPVSVPQHIGPFGVLAVFAACLTAICVHLALLSNKTGFPIILAVILYALAISLFDWNDDYFIRKIDSPVAQSSASSGAQSVTSQKLDDVGTDFVAWLKARLGDSSQRPAGNAGLLPYPVFVVAAEGGGIYAAYNAAIFLARIQDLCHGFHNHLFAISSVSGGSVGAATFLAALDAADKEELTAETDDPCPGISDFLSGAHGLNVQAGPIEGNVDAALKKDYLSPLVAAAFFPNFSQFFIPFRIPAFDRARALEYALEDATDAFSVKPNLLRGAVEDYWTPTNGRPALLINATDTGTGKRTVIAPFIVNKNSTNADSPSGSNTAADNAIANDPFEADPCDLLAETSERFPLSSAAFVSARFPWVTPAASIDTQAPKRTRNTCMTDKGGVTKVRLVDGGYIDNSGIETALETIRAMQEAAKSEKLEGTFRIYLISLSGGDYPDTRVYSFGDIAEPIRALLNGREARAYVAFNSAKAVLNRAQSAPQAAAASSTSFSEPTSISAASVDQNAALPRFNWSKLVNRFYPLPLGWAMSSKTADIVALQSGRFWDCIPTQDFVQTKKYRNNADCVQLEVYDLLNNSGQQTLDKLHTEDNVAAEVAKINRPATHRFLDHNKLMACYEASWWVPKQKQHSGWAQYLSEYQTTPLEALLKEWDRRSGPASIDRTTLAYILGSISEDSDDFRLTTDNLSFRTDEQLLRVWGRKIRKIYGDTSPIDVTPILNNPQRLADLMWGYKNNPFGNNPPNGNDPNLDDSWKFRERGVYQLVGSEQYKEAAGWLTGEDSSFIDIYQNPEAVSNSTVSSRIAFLHFLKSRSGQAVVEALKSDPPDFATARLKQTDMTDGSTDDVQQVEQRSKMFLDCINKSPMPSGAQGSQ